MQDQTVDIVDVNQPSANQIVTGLAWVGYLSIVPTLVVNVAAIALAAFFLRNKNLPIVMVSIFAIAIFMITHKVMVLQSVKLTINDTGVWATKGVLPWKKSCVGLQWRNVGIASYTNDFHTWLFGAYNIRVEDRYTTQIELSVKNLKNGKFIVGEINKRIAGDLKRD